jgi:hypothetical protein
MSGTRLRARRTSRITELSGLIPGGVVETAIFCGTSSGAVLTPVCAFAWMTLLAMAAANVAPITLLAPFLFMFPPFGFRELRSEKQTNWMQLCRTAGGRFGEMSFLVEEKECASRDCVAYRSTRGAVAGHFETSVNADQPGQYRGPSINVTV